MSPHTISRLFSTGLVVLVMLCIGTLASAVPDCDESGPSVAACGQASSCLNPFEADCALGAEVVQQSAQWKCDGVSSCSQKCGPSATQTVTCTLSYECAWDANNTPPCHSTGIPLDDGQGGQVKSLTAKAIFVSCIDQCGG